MIEVLKTYNQLYMQNFSRGNMQEKEIFLLSNKNSNLILTAPHATRSFVNKKEKLSDLYTGALTQYIGEISNTSTIIRQKFTPHKALISDFISQNNLQDHYFLDIHGFKQNINCDICLGIGDFSPQNYPYLEKIIKIAEKYHLKTDVNNLYTGRFGLTGRLQKACHKPNIIQLELSRCLRDFDQNPDIVLNLTVPFLCEICKIYE